MMSSDVASEPGWAGGGGEGAGAGGREAGGSWMRQRVRRQWRRRQLESLGNCDVYERGGRVSSQEWDGPGWSWSPPSTVRRRPSANGAPAAMPMLIDCWHGCRGQGTRGYRAALKHEYTSTQHPSSNTRVN